MHLSRFNLYGAATRIFRKKNLHSVVIDICMNLRMLWTYDSVNNNIICLFSVIVVCVFTLFHDVLWWCWQHICLSLFGPWGYIREFGCQMEIHEDIVKWPMKIHVRLFGPPYLHWLQNYTSVYIRRRLHIPMLKYEHVN